jgi:hypothetical protein
VSVNTAIVRAQQFHLSHTILNNQQCDYHQKKIWVKTWKAVIRALSISTSDRDEASLHGPRYFLEFIHWLRSRGMPKSCSACVSLVDDGRARSLARLNSTRVWIAALEVVSLGCEPPD